MSGGRTEGYRDEKEPKFVVSDLRRDQFGSREVVRPFHLLEISPPFILSQYTLVSTLLFFLFLSRVGWSSYFITDSFVKFLTGRVIFI